MDDVEDIYGSDVEFRIEEEDRESISKPLVEGLSKKKFSYRIRPIKDEFFIDLMKEDHAIRNVALIGHLLHGKTSLVDCLIPKKNFEPKKFTDSLYLEQDRGISIKSSPISLTIQSLRGKTYALNLIDTPGHVNFSDEVTAALRIVDGVVLVVDACDGLMLNSELLLKHALQQHQSIVLCINKIDRLILELRLPPNDAYHKLKKIIDEVNLLIATHSDDDDCLLCPLKGNVCFASSKFQTCFTLKSFAAIYVERAKIKTITYRQFATKLWGDYYLDGETSKFIKDATRGNNKRSFVQFILEPLYKLFRVVIEEPDGDFIQLAKQYDITLPKKHKGMNVVPLLKHACAQLFGSFTSFMDMCAEFIRSPQESSYKVPLIWSGPTNSEICKALLRCRADGPLIVQIVKQYPTLDPSIFNVFGRVMSGTLRSYSEVKILGDSYTDNDDEDLHVLTIRRLWINCTRYEVEVKEIPAGNWALIEGIDQPIAKTCTIVDFELDEDLYIFRPLKYNTKPIVKIAVEPVNPSELSKMLEGLRKCNKSYPILQTKVEESGEHVIIGTGELYLDCVMHDLRRIYTDIDIRVSDPVVCFSETITSMSEMACLGESPNKKNIIKMIAEPLDEGLADELEANDLGQQARQADVERFFKKKYHWDDLSCRSIWAFGPEVNSTNILLNETLPYEVDSNSLNSIKESVVHAFHWATREGPLCEEPMRGVKLKLMYAQIAKEMMHRSGGQIIPTTRRVSYLAILKATPKIMEPYVFTEIVAPPDVVKGVIESHGRETSRTILEDIIVEKRRGRITKKAPIPGTPLFRVEALMPAIDSFGFETDLRLRTTGQAFCQTVFDRWLVVPGDPLDKNIDQYLTPLEPQLTRHLAREFFLKTRKRKGLSEDVNIEKFMDEAMRAHIEAQKADEDELDFNIVRSAV